MISQAVMIWTKQHVEEKKTRVKEQMAEEEKSKAEQDKQILESKSRCTMEWMVLRSTV